jgi:hypothetical protein
VPAFKARYDNALAYQRADFYTSGVAREILDRRAAVLRRDATAVVPAATIDSDVARVAMYLR